MYSLVRPLLFRLDAEWAHHLTLHLLRWAGNLTLARVVLRRMFAVEGAELAVEAFGLRFKNRVGLAAGYDKNGMAVRGLACLGFGHIEVGTITRQAQAGNPRPRVYRVADAEAVINSMGFPNDGVAALCLPSLAIPVGVNIGKSKTTPLAEAAEEYCVLYRQVYGQADYITVNISSPNTLNLRQLQARTAIEELLTAITATRNAHQPRRPLLVKIAPDLSTGEIDDLLGAALATGIDGVIATNTTTSRAGIPAALHDLPGGVSGAPLRERSTAVVRHIAQQTGGRLPIIGVGGIHSAAHALEKLAAGATLVQLYTGLVYTGPGLVRQILVAMKEGKER
jgi:dihydroorotate dehydrogenase